MDTVSLQNELRECGRRVDGVSSESDEQTEDHLRP